MSRPVIQEFGRPHGALVKAEPSKVDLQDCLIVAGMLFGESAAIAIWWPAALILASFFCLGFAFLIEKSKKTKL